MNPYWVGAGGDPDFDDRYQHKKAALTEGICPNCGAPLIPITPEEHDTHHRHPQPPTATGLCSGGGGFWCLRKLPAVMGVSGEQITSSDIGESIDAIWLPGRDGHG